jgi:SAM-dependent methyltransferase
MANKSASHGNEKLRILDIGCGRGNLLKAFHSNNCDCFGVERNDFPAGGTSSDITIFKEDFLGINFDDNSFDIVIIWHVLEHLTDPASTLAKVRKILKPMGSLVIAVPNIGSLQSTLFSKHWFHLDLPRHTYHFNKNTLANILETNRFSINLIRSGGIDQNLFGFIQSTINALKISAPNTLYTILKTHSSNITIATKLFQCSICILLIPVSLLEFILSTVMNSCASLTASATKLPGE